MARYLLLRDNKESGPYSFDELLQKGLKPYDLVWIEGKSAAWRYPSEVAELKAYAPVVEEQPFDRFYKKQEESQHWQYVNQSEEVKTVSSARPAPQPVAAATPKAAVVTVPTNHVYVTLPAGKKNVAQKEVVPVDIPKPEPLIHTRYQPASEAAEIISRHEEPVVLEQKFVQPLDEIKRQYTEKVLNRGTVARKPFYVQPAILIVAVVAILATGMFIGASLKSPVRGNNSTASTSVDAGQAKFTVQSKVQPENISASLPVVKSPEQSDNLKSEDLSSSPKNTAPASTEFNEKAKKSKSTPIQNQHPTQVTSTKLLSAPQDSVANVSKEIQHKTESTPVSYHEPVKLNMSDYVLVSNSRYDVGTFGGINNLQVTVSNRSPFPLDLVVVEIQYIQANKKIFKTENLYFRNVPSGSALMQQAPSSSRGVKVECHASLINARQSSSGN